MAGLLLVEHAQGAGLLEGRGEEDQHRGELVARWPARGGGVGELGLEPPERSVEDLGVQ
jgi:hypothetical protein